MVDIGYRDPLTYKKLDTVNSISLTNDVLAIEKLIREHKNKYVHQYLYELKQGLNPRKSEWYKKLK